MQSSRSALVLLAIGCSGGDGGDTDSAVPPAICKQPGEPAGDWYTEVTDEVGLAPTGDVVPQATSVVGADLDGDGWIDFYASLFPSQREPVGGTRTRFLYMNRPNPDGGRMFVETTDESGLLATRDGDGGRGLTMISFGDLDGDGDVDAVGCSAEISTAIVDPCAAFLNDGTAHFTLADGGDLETDLFSVPTSTLFDYDRDGILDFWPGTIGQWQYGPADVSPPRLFRGNGDGTFDEVSKKAGLPDDFGTSSDYRMNFGVTACDVDLDGDDDVIVGDYGVPIGPDYLWRNDDGKFTDIAADLGFQRQGIGGFTFSVSCGDLDGDGDVDLMKTGVAHPGQGTDTSALLIGNTPPGEALAPFDVAVDADHGIERVPGDEEGDNIAFFQDLDLDGAKDILLTSSNYPQQSPGDDEYTHTWVWRQTSPLQFANVTPQTPFVHPKQQTLEGAALLDYDNDGDLDVIVGKGLFNSTWIAENLGITTAAIEVFRNDVGQDENWTRIRVIGAGAGAANPSGIGALVTVTAGGTTQQQEVQGSWGHSNTQADTWLTFGLGGACTIDSIEVRWPDSSGTVTTVQDVLANYPVDITQGQPGFRYRY